MLNKIEEHHPLTYPKFQLRGFVKESTRKQSVMIAEYWRQGGKVWHCILGDENTRYHHMCTSICMRSAPIRQLLDEQGNPAFDHASKERILHTYYQILLGTETATIGLGARRSLTQHYAMDEHQARMLAAPFSPEEIRSALFSIKADSASGPDGFSAKFFQANWPLLQRDIEGYITNFCNETADMQGIN